MARILLIEDNELNREMLSCRLEHGGHHVVCAADGAEGMDVARSAIPGAIPMDLSMPALDGWEATRRLKADEATSHIPVIALTAHAMSGDRENALEAGCDEYESKPVDFCWLPDKIDAHME